MEELRKRFERCLEEDDLDLENVWSKLIFGSSEKEPDLDELLKFIGHYMETKDEFYEYLDEVDLDHLKTFCDSLSPEDKMKLKEIISKVEED